MHATSMNKPTRTQRRVLFLVSCCALFQFVFHASTISSLSDKQDGLVEAPTLSSQSRREFPRILHYLWPNNEFSFGNDDPNHVEQQRTLHFVNRIQQNNPGWSVKVWTDDECHDFMRQHFAHYYQQWISLSPRLKMWDAVRPCILWIYGGIYLDHDVACDEGVKFDDWISNTATLLLRTPLHSKHKLGNHFMGSIPHHSLWKLYLDNIWMDTPKNYSVLRHTGPKQLYPTFMQYLDTTNTTLPASHIRLLSLQEFENDGECLRLMNGNTTYCSPIPSIPKCTHLHSISPAELNGEDDNADFQISKYKERLENYTNTDKQNYTQVSWACTRLNDFITKTDNIASERPVVFVHSPKTAGTSVEAAMGFKRTCHATALDYMECNATLYQDALTFTTMRHPVDRIVSLYNYARNGGNGGKKDALKFKWVQSLDFGEFVKELPIQREVNFAPQSHFITNANGKVIVNEVLCFERLDQDWTLLQAREPGVARLGDLPIERLRSSSGASNNKTFTVEQVDSDTRRRLEEFFHHDFQLWNKYCNDEK